MDAEIPVNAPTQVNVSERVKFRYEGRDIFGYVGKKGKNRAIVFTDDQKEFRVPYSQLIKIPGIYKSDILGQKDRLRLQFQCSDKISFLFNAQELVGTITRLDRKYARVVTQDNRDYRVPYRFLTKLASSETGQPDKIDRGKEQLDQINRRAWELLTFHNLTGWGFQLDYGTKRAGACRYDLKIISISYEFARSAPDEEIEDTLLHEIAHALLGKAHNHDALWKAKAREIGCSGRRTHGLSFTPPRYIVTCQNNCWVATVERRRLGGSCRCGGKIIYLLYSEELLHKLKGKNQLKIELNG